MGRQPPVQLSPDVLGTKTKENIIWIPFRLVCLAYLLLSVKPPGQLVTSVQAVWVYATGGRSSQLTAKSN